MYKKTTLLTATASLLLLTAACGTAQPAADQQHKKDQQHVADAKTKTIKTAAKKTAPKKTVIKKPAVPFKAIQPSKNAQPLIHNYTKDTIKNMPVIEAHGHSRLRSVPLGQTLLKGKTDETNGPLKNHRLVAFYGNPHSTQMGILGEKSPQALMTQLKQEAQAYSNADPAHPAIPTIELITTIAQRNPGPEGHYYHMTSKDDIKTYAKLAKDNGAILLLDVQLGSDTVMHQVKLLAPYLKLPYVDLAIDTEFHVKSGQIPGVNLGHVDGNAIQQAVQYVNDMVVKNNLPDKVVLVHQFMGDVIYNKQAIHPTKHVEVALNYDGFGAPGSKMASYHGLVRNEPVQYGGFKLFFKADHPLLSPLDVLKLDPAPAVIDYQ